MIHKCKVQCHTISPTDIDKFGLEEDNSKWLPFAIDLGTINAIKLTTDDHDASSYGCSTIFTNNGDTFILDTPYDKLLKKWSDYIDSIWNEKSSGDDEEQHPDVDGDINL